MKTDPNKQAPPNTEIQAQEIAEEAAKELRQMDPNDFRSLKENGLLSNRLHQDKGLEARLSGAILAQCPPDEVDQMHISVMSMPKENRPQEALDQILAHPPA